MQEREIPLDEIEENEANAYAQTDIDELAESIKVVGLQQPLVVWPKPEGGYLLIAGHRRRNALALLGRKTASCRCWIRISTRRCGRSCSTGLTRW